MASFLRLQFFFFGFRHHCRRRHRRWYNYCISMSICLYSILLSVMYLPCEQNAMIIGIIYSLISSSLKYVWAFQVLCFVNRMAKLAKRFANTLWLYHLSTHTHSSNTLSSQPWSLSLSLSACQTFGSKSSVCCCCSSSVWLLKPMRRAIRKWQTMILSLPSQCDIHINRWSRAHIHRKPHSYVWIHVERVRYMCIFPFVEQS